METTSVDFHRVISPSFLGQYSWLPTAEQWKIHNTEWWILEAPVQSPVVLRD